MIQRDKWENKHLKDVARYVRQIEAIYQSAVRDIASVGSTIPDFNPDKPFSFADYPNTRARIEKLLKSLKNDIQLVVLNGIEAEWTLANNKNNELCNVVFGRYAQKLTAQQERRYYSNNDKARKAFAERKVAGLDLSDRVWRYTDQFKTEMEMGLDLGLRDGLSADEMSRTLRQYLQQPDRLFRRVKDEHGILHLSKQAKAYHPGQGVYRSSYKNARRLAATETNIAYRTSDYTRWQQLDFVVGIEIKLSNNHTLNGVPFTDICDDLAGKYPKDFKFTGWHPHCRCYAVSILKTPEEIEADNERIMAGEPLDGKSVNKVTSVSAKFDQWIADNKERAKGWSAMPYFVRQNPEYIQGFEVDAYSPAERKFTRARRTNEAMQESLGIFLQSKYPALPNTEKAAIFHYPQGEGATFRQLNNQLRRGNLTEFNEAFSELLSKGLSKLETTTETVYRSVRLNKTCLREFIEWATKSENVAFRGFTSGSLDRNTAIEFGESHKGRKKNETDVLLVIRGKSGHPIEGLSQFSGRFNGKPNQREVLFDKGSKFTFTGYHEKDGVYEFFISEI